VSALDPFEGIVFVDGRLLRLVLPSLMANVVQGCPVKAPARIEGSGRKVPDPFKNQSDRELKVAGEKT